jgi:hypothetical protein
MSRPSLTLYAATDSRHIAHAELIDLLKSIELIGNPVATSQFLAGPRFFSQIVFLGCAPNILIDPKQGTQHIRIAVPVLSKPELFSARLAPAPVCPACKQEIEHWKQHIGATENGEIICPRCHVSTPVSHLNLRKRACFSKHIIRIAPVFESEAVPADGLMDTLSKIFSVHFTYAFTG